MQGRQISQRRRKTPGRHPAGTRHPRSVGARPRPLRPTRGPGSISASGTSAIRSASRNPRKSQRAYAFLPVEGEGLHQIPVGPVHAGIIEPGHFRFTANGEHVVRLEQRLGYVHKGIEGLMAGAPLERAAKLACRCLRRQRGRLFLCLRAGRRIRLAGQSAGARGLSARADGGAGAAGQPFRRHRRHLQRRIVRAHACANQHPARAHLADAPRPASGIG